MKKLNLLILILVMQLPIYAQENVDVLLQLETNTNLSASQNNIIGKKIATSSVITKKEGSLIFATSNNSSEIIWNLTIQVMGAKAIVPYFDELIIKDGTKIRAFSMINESTTKYFYKNENRLTNSFALPLVKGNKIAFVAIFPNQAGYDSFKFSFLEVGGIYSLKGFGDAPACYANVHCTEGSPWQDQIRSVAKYMIVSGTDISYCTGSLVNNTNEDCKNYFLSAQHCGMSSSSAEFGQFVFYFNYEANSCISPATDNGLDEETVVGCTKISSSGTSTSHPPDGSDFLLMELNTIPSTYNVYYAGWNRDDIPQILGNGAIIQHPEGDLKKISFWSTIDYGISNSTDFAALCVSSANGEGTVQPMSSGSPVFDGNKNIVGNIATGSGACISDVTDPFAGGGRFNAHWVLNGITSDLQLKPWLDPTNSGVMFLNGIQQCSTVGINEEQSNYFIKIYPNPTNQFITINANIIIDKVNIYSLDGKLLLASAKGNKIDVSKLPSGMLIVEIYDENGEIAHSKVYKQ